MILEELKCCELLMASSKHGNTFSHVRAFTSLQSWRTVGEGATTTSTSQKAASWSYDGDFLRNKQSLQVNGTNKMCDNVEPTYLAESI